MMRQLTVSACRASAWLLTAACSTTIYDAQDEPGESENDGFGAIVEPRLGTTISGDTRSATVAIKGVHIRPDEPIVIQVPERPDDLTSWITIATTQTSSVPSATDPEVFEWQASVVPALDPARWPQGGLLRLRAVDATGKDLPGFFQDRDGCFADSTEWRLASRDAA
jgi:hypothetical protein